MRAIQLRRSAATVIATTLTAAVFVGWLTLIATPSPSFAEDGTPKRKDTSAKLKPKAVALATEVEPEEAKPGETVKLRVTAKLDPKWHIYSTTQGEGGPKKTEFDLFQPDGLTVDGDWEPTEEPIRKKEPLFPDLDQVEFFEDEVTWEIPLKVPDDAKPGTRTIKVQASYQICDDSSCSIPGRWTLPAAELKVVEGDGSPGSVGTAAPAAPAPSEPVAAAPESESAEPAPAALAGSEPEEPVATNEVQESLKQGLIPFLLKSAGAGLLALIMPCVWPMVPITVNFFVKQGHLKAKNGGGGNTTGLALTYSLTIVVIFTLVGLLFSAIFGASSLQQLATSAWLNFLVAALFIAFGLSLLGVFEFRLPSFLLNASAQGESRGGLVGVIFMALTLTITSFTCTFPVVGALLVMAAGGEYFYPAVGLATFATVIALPFFLLALMPGLISKLPRSGDWMNSVKVVGGLLEVGAAFKFLNNAEIGMGTTPENAWFDSQVVLAIWVVLALICGLYLLGLFRTDHDLEAPRVGPGRMLFGAGFLSLALFLAPALFGNPPESRVWDRLVVGLLPPDLGDLARPAGATGGGEGVMVAEQKAVSTDPAIAIREQRSFHGVAWGWSYDLALEEAKKEGKPILIDFTGVLCPNCRWMEQSVFPKPAVVAKLKDFVTVQLYTDKVPIATLSNDDQVSLAEENALRLIDLAHSNTNPSYVALSPDGKVLGRQSGASEPEAFAAFLGQALDRFRTDNRVATTR